MTALLESRGFTVAVPRTPEELTADSIAASLVRLVDETRAGDLSVIYLSGHGYRYPDTDLDEADGWDESFVCADRPIPDDWFRRQLWPRARSGGQFVTVVDACHSDSITLGLRTENKQVPFAPLVDRGYYRLVLSACRDEEVAKDLGGGLGGGGVVTTQMPRR